ncbi:MAG: helix-turn-helix domain-containing protein [Nitrospirae bacterium]|nr:helix-turn-helix domain-containing protein [Nitrospirota bacterium]
MLLYTDIATTQFTPKGYPVAPSTLGEHLRKRCLDLGLLQAQVAEWIGVKESTEWNWEHGRKPVMRYQAKIIEFLGYRPGVLNKRGGELTLPTPY